MQRIKCTCNCKNQNELWDICLCECKCSKHRVIETNKEYWEKREKQRFFIKKMIEKKQKEQLENDIDKIVFSNKKEE